MTNERLISCTTSYPDLCFSLSLSLSHTHTLAHLLLDKYYLRAVGIFFYFVKCFFSLFFHVFPTDPIRSMDKTRNHCMESYVTRLTLPFQFQFSHSERHTERERKWIPLVCCHVLFSFNKNLLLNHTIQMTYFIIISSELMVSYSNGPMMNCCTRVVLHFIVYKWWQEA